MSEGGITSWGVVQRGGGFGDEPFPWGPWSASSPPAASRP